MHSDGLVSTKVLKAKRNGFGVRWESLSLRSISGGIGSSLAWRARSKFRARRCVSRQLSGFDSTSVSSGCFGYVITWLEHFFVFVCSTALNNQQTSGRMFFASSIWVVIPLCVSSRQYQLPKVQTMIDVFFFFLKRNNDKALTLKIAQPLIKEWNGSLLCRALINELQAVLQWKSYLTYQLE